MKKFFLYLLTLSFFLIPSPTSAAAEEYVRAEKEGIGFYKTPTAVDSEILFYLEKSYYLKITETGNVFYQVSLFDGTDGFSKIYGYVKKSDVSVVYETPAAPIYPEEKLTVTKTTSLYPLPNSDESLSTCLQNQQARYYGMLPYNEDVYYYVRFGNEFGYLKSTDVSAPQIPLHPTPLPEPELPPDDDNTKPPEKPPAQTADGTQLALVLLICIPAVVIVVVLFLPNKKRREPRYIEYKDEFHNGTY